MIASLWEWSIPRDALGASAGVSMTRHGAMEALAKALIGGERPRSGQVVPLILAESPHRPLRYLRGWPKHTAVYDGRVIEWRQQQATGRNHTMTEGTGSAGSARARTSRAVARLLEGSPLHIQELAYELLVTNPDDPEKGQVHVAYADAYVSWERMTWDYWGTLEGFADEPFDVPVTRRKIMETLGVNAGP